jgi:glycosyltransferase involved in cell wall biosynthesis
MAELSAPPRVSVIVIFLNEERYLDEAIRSVFAQTFSDWELILVDDGSTDGSTAIAQATADGARIRYIDHPGHRNRGMSASRNAGIAASCGEFVAFLDADDVWLPGKLTDQIAIFDARPETDMAYGRTLIWHEWTSEPDSEDYCFDLGVDPDRIYPAPELFPLLVRNRAQTPTTINAIMRRTLIDQVGGFEEEFRGMFEDQAFFAKTHLVANCHVDDRVWAKYRQHPSSCTARSSGTLGDLLARRRFLNWVDQYLRRQRITEKRLHREVRIARRALTLQILRYRLRQVLRRV